MMTSLVENLRNCSCFLLNFHYRVYEQLATATGIAALQNQNLVVLPWRSYEEKCRTGHEDDSIETENRVRIT